MILFVKPKTHHQETNFISGLKNHVINKPVRRPMTNANYSFAPFMRERKWQREINISILCFSLDEMFRSRLIEGHEGRGAPPRVSIAPKTLSPFPFKRLPHRLSSKPAMKLIFTYPDIIYKQASIAGSGYLNLGRFPHKYGNFEIKGEIKS